MRIATLLLPLLIALLPLHAESPKLQLLFLKMEHCPWCQRMEQDVFEDPKILKKLQAMYVIKKVERGDPTLPSSLHPRFYPTTYIFTPDGKKLLDELPGYMEPKRFLDYLQELYALEQE